MKHSHRFLHKRRAKSSTVRVEGGEYTPPIGNLGAYMYVSYRKLGG